MNCVRNAQSSVSYNVQLTRTWHAIRWRIIHVWNLNKTKQKHFLLGFNSKSDIDLISTKILFLQAKVLKLITVFSNVSISYCFIIAKNAHNSINSINKHNHFIFVKGKNSLESYLVVTVLGFMYFRTLSRMS